MFLRVSTKEEPWFYSIVTSHTKMYTTAIHLHSWKPFCSFSICLSSGCCTFLIHSWSNGLGHLFGKISSHWNGCCYPFENHCHPFEQQRLSIRKNLHQDLLAHYNNFLIDSFFYQPSRDAHPSVFFSCNNSEPLVLDILPFDKYELEPSPLTQYILERKSPSNCWQVSW